MFHFDSWVVQDDNKNYVLRQDSDRTEPNEVELIISETDSEPTDNNNPHLTLLHDSHALNPEAAEPQTLGRQAETPLSPDKRDCITDGECKDTGAHIPSTDVYDCKGSPPKTHCLATVSHSQQPTPEEDVKDNLGPFPNELEQAHHADDSVTTGVSCDVWRHCFVIAGLCEHEGLSSQVQLGAMVALLVYLQTNQQAIQVRLTPRHRVSSEARQLCFPDNRSLIRPWLVFSGMKDELVLHLILLYNFHL